MRRKVFLMENVEILQGYVEVMKRSCRSDVEIMSRSLRDHVEVI